MHDLRRDQRTMITTPTTTSPDELELASSILERMSSDLSMIVDRDFRIDDVEVDRQDKRPGGGPEVHISFKFGIVHNGVDAGQGCLLVPLPEALALAGYMMMLSNETVAGERKRTELDGPYKESLLEVGKFLAGACDLVLRRMLSENSSARSDGCQGVRANVRPALAYREGEQLLVARARARIHDFEPFELMLVLPAFQGAVQRETLSA